MFGHYLSQAFNCFLPKTKNISNQELKDLTLKYFYSPFETTEVENIIEVGRFMLCALPAQSPEFNKTYDSIIFGSIVLAMAIEAKKYGTCFPQYPLSLNELKDRCGIEKFATMGAFATDLNLRRFIMSIGERILNQSLPFDAAYLTQLNLTLNKHVSFKERLEKYQQTHCIEQSQHIDAEENKRPSL